VSSSRTPAAGRTAVLRCDRRSGRSAVRRIDLRSGRSVVGRRGRRPLLTTALAVLAAAVVAVALGASVPGVALAADEEAPQIQATSAAVMDVPTGRFVYELNADKRVPMASTTKVMTARVVLESGIDLQEQVTVPQLEIRWDEMDVGLKPGQRLSVDLLLEALLVASGGDAAKTLAAEVAGSEQAFVELMNQEAEELGLDDTHYANSHGLDAGGHYTTARDLTELTRVEMEDERFAAYVATRQVSVPQQDAPALKVDNTNKLMLRNNWVTGGKTGYTSGAGYCLVASGTYDGHEMIVTVLGAPDPETRNRDVVKLFKYGASLYQTWKSPAAGALVATATVPYSRLSLDIVQSKRFSVSIPPGAEVREEIDTPRTVSPPVARNETLGRVSYAVDGDPTDERALVADREIPVADWRSRLRYRLWRIWDTGRDALADAFLRAADPRAVFTPAF